MFFHIKEMTKMTLRVLLRNKLFLFFAIALMILATLVLNVSIQSVEQESSGVTVLDKLNDQMAYLEDVEKFQVKVYSQGSDAEGFLEEMTDAGMFQFFLVNCQDRTETEIMESARYTAKHDKVDAIMLIGKGDLAQSVSIYKTGEDERYDFFEKYVEAKLKGLGTESLGKTVVVEEIASAKPDTILEMDVDAHKTGIFGNVLAIYTVAFVFSGIIILGTITSERESRVYTRIILSKASAYSYIVSKFMVIFLTSVLETGVAILSYTFLVKTEVGLTIPQFGLILLGMALIFNSLSVGIGICCGNTLTACLVSFTMWVFTALLGGLYFDISNGTVFFKRIASIMPQRWGLKAATLFLEGNSMGYPLIIVTSVTYIVVILLIGVLGLKLTERE